MGERKRKGEGVFPSPPPPPKIPRQEGGEGEKGGVEEGSVEFSESFLKKVSIFIVFPNFSKI